jgi:hypothetical protein
MLEPNLLMRSRVILLEINKVVFVMNQCLKLNNVSKKSNSLVVRLLLIG